MRGGTLTALGTALAAFSMLTAPAPALAEGVTAAPTPASTGAPTLTGTPAPGQTLTCSPGSWSGNPSSLAYAWLRDGSPIAGQAGSTYVVQNADQGHSISCQVTASNAGGEYTIVGLPSASYKVEFVAFEGNNYLFQYFNGQSSEPTANPVSVTAPGTTGAINAEMHPGGQITGKVTAAAGGASVAEVAVCVEAEKIGERCAYTNGGGEYTIVGLPTGSYTVWFYPEESNYLEQPYGSNPVSVAAGSPTPNVDAALATGGEISGRVTAEEGAGAIVGGEACPYEPTSKRYWGCATTNGNGEYTIVGLPTGEYEVTFYAFGCGESGCKQQNYISKTVTTIHVAAGSTTPNVDEALATGGQISGTVSGLEGGANVEVCADEPTESYFACADTNTNGEYSIPALNTGHYTVEFHPTYVCEYGCTFANYVSEAYGKNPVSVTAGKITSPINATMTVAGKISGRITAETGGGPVAAEACAFATKSFFSGGCTYANSNGEYTIQGLPTGTYTVYFYGEVCAIGGCAPQNYIAKTTTGVSVTDGSTTPNTDAALATGGQITGRVTDATTHAGLADIDVCAATEVNEETLGGCATTTSAAKSSTTASSNALAVPAPVSSFKLLGSSFDAKTGNLAFTFQFANAGKLSWKLSFHNSDVGFADSLGISLGGGNSIAEAAKSKGKSKHCKKGFTKHAGKCVRLLVPFSSGSQNVLAGTVKVTVHASAKALKALKNGHTLHVSGTFSFQSSLGGAPTTKDVMVIVHPPKTKGKHGKHSKHGG